MKTLTAIIAAAAISVTATGTVYADSVADQQVRSTLNQSMIQGHAQSVAIHQYGFVNAGKSVAASRVEHVVNSQSIRGENMSSTSRDQRYDNDSGMSVSASRVERALNDNA